mmetsp:Transcript_42495/g.97375  ORF Transcript_42495/g.97375 Transcript_42495/m.97375 type:complete len:400 (-) Transcript_42495:124-1323(-)
MGRQGGTYKAKERDSEKDRAEKDIAVAETFPGFTGRFGNKSYKAHVARLFTTTNVKPRHVDDKAVLLLDALAERGRVEEACKFLTQTLEGANRITNWRAYIYTLLKGFDEEAYRAVKSSQSASRRKRVTERKSTAEVKEEEQEEEGAEEVPIEEEDDEVRAPGTCSVVDVLAATDSEGSDREKPSSGTRLSQLITDPDTVREFVPKQQPIKLSVHSSIEPATTFRHTAPEFVPGRTWIGVDTSSVSSTGGMRSDALEFYPGRQWAGDGGKASNDGLARATGTASPALIAASAAQAALAAAAASTTTSSATVVPLRAATSEGSTHGLNAAKDLGNGSTLNGRPQEHLESKENGDRKADGSMESSLSQHGGQLLQLVSDYRRPGAIVAAMAVLLLAVRWRR